MDQSRDMTQPLPGWIRLNNIETGKTLDINPNDCTHRLLLEKYVQNPKWRQLNTAQ